MPPRQGVQAFSTRVAIVILRVWWSLNFLEDRAIQALGARGNAAPDRQPCSSRDECRDVALALRGRRRVLGAEYDLPFAAYHLNYARDRARQARYVFGVPRCRFLERGDGSRSRVGREAGR